MQIMAEVLGVTAKGALKTQIMYKASLSFAQVNECLSLLLGFGLLKKRKASKRTVYKTTRKGVRYLKSYDEIRALLRNEEQNVKKNPPSYLIKSFR